MNNPVSSGLRKIKWHSISLFIIGIGSIFLPLLDRFDVLPSLFLEILDLALLGFAIYALNLPRIALGIKINRVCTLPFLVAGILSYVFIQHNFDAHELALLFIGIYLILMFQIERHINWQNLQGRLEKTYITNFNSAKKSDPDFDHKNAHVFWKLITVPELRLLNVTVVMRLTFPIYFGIFAFTVTLGMLESHFAFSSILATILIFIAGSKIKEFKFTSARYKLLQVLRFILKKKDSIEETETEFAIRKFVSPRALLYVLIVGTTIVLSFQIPIVFITFACMLLEDHSDITISLKILFSALLSIGFLPLLLPAYCGIKIFLTNSFRKTKILPYAYPWLAYSAVVFFIIKYQYPPLSWLVGFNISGIELRAIIFGSIGLLSLIHIVISHKLRKSVLLTRNMENIIALLLIPVPIMILTVNGDFVTSILNIILPSWLWYSIIAFFRTPISDEFKGKSKIHLLSLVGCLIAIGGYFLFKDQILLSFACFFAAGLASILFLEEKKRKQIAKVVFGISESLQPA